MIPEIGARIESVFTPKDEASFTKTLWILQDALSGNWAATDPDSTRTLIGRSLKCSKTFDLRKQWEVIKLVEKIAQNLGNDLKISISGEIIDVNAHFLISLSPSFDKAYLSQTPVEVSSDELKFLLKTPFELPEDQALIKLLSEAYSYGMEGKAYPILERLKSLFNQGKHQTVFERMEESSIPPEIKNEIVHLALDPINQRTVEADDDTINRILKLLPDDLETLNLSGFRTKKIADEKRYPELQRFENLKTLICSNNREAYGIAHLPKLFPKLENLDISYCPALKRLPEEMNLRTLTIYGNTNITPSYLKRFCGLHPNFESLVFKTDRMEIITTVEDYGRANNYKTIINDG